MLVELDFRYMISYSGLIVTHCLTRLGNLNGPHFDLSRSLNVLCNFAVEFFYCCLLVNTCMFIAHGLAVIGIWKVSYHFGQNFGQTTQNRITSSWVRSEGYHQI